MSKTKVFNTVSKAFLTVTILGFSVLAVGNQLAEENYQRLSDMLGQPTSEIIKDPNASSKDLEYFKSSFDYLKDVRNNAKVYAETIQAEGTVLLKNKVVDGKPTLPLAKKSKVNLYSPTSVNVVSSQGGSSSIDGKTVTLLEGFTEAGLEVNEDLYNWYSENIGTYGRKNIMGAGGMGAMYNVREPSWDQITTPSKEAEADAAIFVLGRAGCEAIDLQIHAENNEANIYGNKTRFDYKNGNALKINDEEREVLNKLVELKNAGKVKKVILLLNTNNHFELEFLQDIDIDACLWIGSIGSVGAYAVGDILTGNVNPSGRLPDTIWNYHYLNPVHANFGILADSEINPNITQWKMIYNNNDLKKYSKHVVYQEGIYSGYRYTETRYEDSVLKRENVGTFDYNEAVAYPFGYGLSYSNFEYSNMRLNEILPTEANGLTQVNYEALVDVTNIGSVDGREAAQLYVQKPYTQYDIDNGIEKASVELAGIAKTKVLKPGEKQTLKITMEGEYLASYDSHKAKTYIIDEGDYYFTIGKNAHNATNNILTSKGKTTADGMTSKGDASLVKKIHLDFDDVTYSTSKVKGHEDVKITNHFDDADLNIYDTTGTNHVDYVTRNNWDGTVKFGLTKDNQRTFTQTNVKVTDAMAQDFSETFNTFPEESKGKDYPTFGSKKTSYSLVSLRAIDDGDGDPTNDKPIPYDDPMWDDLLDQLTWDEYRNYLGNANYGNGSIESISKPYVADRDGGNGVGNYAEASGLIARKDDPDRGVPQITYPANSICAATFNLKLVDYYGRQWGEDCLWAGIGGLYGVSLDMHRSPFGGRNGEYYSEDPILTGLMAGTMAKGMATRGVYTYNKHAFLNEQETYRCGGMSWANEQTCREVYLRPFAMTVRATQLAGIMTSLNCVGMKWAGCHGFVNSVLRNENGMMAHCVTDSLFCHNGDYGRGMFYGNDLPLGGYGADRFNKAAPTKPEGGENAGEYGKYVWAMRESIHRCLYTICHSFIMNGLANTDTVVQITPAWHTALNISTIIVDVLFGVSVAAYGVSIALIYIEKFKKGVIKDEQK